MLSDSEDRAVTRFLHLFGLNPAKRGVLYQGEGLLIDTARAELPVILKIIASPRPGLDDLRAQLDWVLYLHQNGMNVPEPLLARSGSYLAQVCFDRVYYSAHAYPKFALSPENEIDWKKNRSLPVKLGEFMARMHNLSQTYHPASSRPEMGHWDALDWLQPPAQVLHPSQSALAAPISRLKERIAGFPKTAANYGLIHDDLHTGNVFHQGDELLVIDFECCHQGWFTADIASALLFSVWIGPEKEQSDIQEQAIDFLQKLIRGYQALRPLPLGWALQLPDFLKLREISLFLSFYHSVDRAAGYHDALFEYLYERIRLEKPFLNIDFSQFAA